MKKFVFLSLTVLLGVSLFVIGCGDAETGPAGTGGSPGRSSTSVAGPWAVADLQALVDAAVADGETIRLVNVTLSDAGTVNFKTAGVQIAGTLTTDSSSATLLSAAQASLSFADGAGIVSGNAGDILIVKSAEVKEKVSGLGAAVVGTDTLPADAKAGDIVAVENLPLSSETGGGVITGLTVYVYGTLTINADSKAPAGNVKAIETVHFGGDTDLLSTASTIDLAGATEITATGNVNVTPGTTVAWPAINLAAGQTLTLTGVTDITADIVRGTLILPGVVTKALINKDIVDGVGSAVINFTGAPAFATASTIKAATISFTGAVTSAKTLTLRANTITFGGTFETTDESLEVAGSSSSVTFANTATFADGASFAGDVVFKDDVTLTANAANFGGGAFFADTKKITLTAASSVITLEPGAFLAHGAPADIPGVFSAIIANFDEDDVTLTPTANTTLTFGANGTKSIAQAGTAGHGITIAGNATLVPAATYTVASADSAIGVLTVGGTLTVGDGLLTGLPEGVDNTASTSAKLVLTGATSTNGATLKGAGTVVAGGTEIVGGTNGWQVVNSAGTDTVTLKADAIAASATTAVFTAVGSDKDAIITVPEAKTFTIEANTTVDLKGTDSSVVGSIVLKGADSGTNGGTLAFAKGTTSIVKTANSGSTASNETIENADVGNGLTVLQTGSSPYPLVSITSKDVDEGRTIKAGTEGEDVTLDGATVAGKS